MSPNLSLEILLSKYWNERMDGCCHHCGEIHEYTKRNISRKQKLSSRNYAPYPKKSNLQNDMSSFDEDETDQEPFVHEYPSLNINYQISKLYSSLTHLKERSISSNNLLKKSHHSQSSETITMICYGEKDERTYPLDTLNINGTTLNVEIKYIKTNSIDEADEEQDLYDDFLDAIKLQSASTENLKFR